MLIAICAALFRPSSQALVAEECLEGGMLSCQVAWDHLKVSGWMNPHRLERDQTVAGMVKWADPDDLRMWWSRSEDALACTALGHIDDDIRWYRAGCETGDTVACGLELFALPADAAAEERQGSVNRALQGCREGSDLSCAAFADAVRLDPSLGDRSAALAWSQLACSLSWGQESCAAAGRWMSAVEDEESARVYHDKACDQGYRPSCARDGGGQGPLEIVEGPRIREIPRLKRTRR